MSGPVQEPDDAELARAARAGSTASFEELVRRYEARLLRFLRQRTGNRHDAEDLAQMAFVAAYRALGRYDPRRPFAPWLFVIAARLAMDHARRARRFVPLAAGQAPAAAAADVFDGAAAPLWRLARARLPEAQFDVLWLRYGEDLTVREVARASGRTTGSVKVLLHRGRRALARLLAEQGGRE